MKKRRIAKAAERTPAPASLKIISFYRQHARRCEASARNAPNEKMRAELSKMADVWRELATDHERMAREGSDLNIHIDPNLKGWM